MALVDLNKPGEKKKLIWAAVLGFVAIVFLWWTFFGFGSSSSSSRATARPQATPTPQRPGGQNNTATNGRPTVNGVDVSVLRPIDFQHSSYDAPEAKRNIFAFWVPPPKPVPAQKIETPRSEERRVGKERRCAGW